MLFRSTIGASEALRPEEPPEALTAREADLATEITDLDARREPARIALDTRRTTASDAMSSRDIAAAALADAVLLIDGKPILIIAGAICGYVLAIPVSLIIGNMIRKQDGMSA